MTKQTYKRTSNHMRIRVIEPFASSWLPITDSNGKYIVGKAYEKPSFRPLDLGRKNKQKNAKMRGIWVVRGVLKTSGLQEGDLVKPSDWTTQSIRIEYKRIKSRASDDAETKIRKLRTSKYWSIIEKFLSNEYGKKMIDIDVVKKQDGDFYLKIT